MKIVTRPLSTLNPDPRNARRHGQRNIESIKASLTTFGQVEPLVVNKTTGLVVGGHGRIEAMMALGWTDAKVVEIEVSEEKAPALSIALNRTAELAEWDDAELVKLLGELQDVPDFDFEVTGFTDDELSMLASPPPEIPDSNKPIDESELAKTEHACPSCGFKW